MSDFISLLDIVAQEGAPTGLYHASTGEGHSIKEIFDEICAYLNVRPAEEVPVMPAGPDDVSALVLDPSHTERTFGWKARVCFKDTIRRQLDWYGRHGVTDVYSHLAPPRQ
jgi:nucleoside-diphosphate-sugar epimerase